MDGDGPRTLPAFAQKVRRRSSATCRWFASVTAGSPAMFHGRRLTPTCPPVSFQLSIDTCSSIEQRPQRFEAALPG